MSYCTVFFSPFLTISLCYSLVTSRGRRRAGRFSRCESKPAWKIYRRTRGDHRGSQTRDLAINPRRSERSCSLSLFLSLLIWYRNSSLHPSVFILRFSLYLSLALCSPRARREAMDRRIITSGGNYFAPKWIINERFPRSDALLWRILLLINNFQASDDAVSLPSFLRRVD